MGIYETLYIVVVILSMISLPLVIVYMMILIHNEMRRQKHKKLTFSPTTAEIELIAYLTNDWLSTPCGNLPYLSDKEDMVINLNHKLKTYLENVHEKDSN